MIRLAPVFALIVLASPALAEPIILRGGETTYTIDPATLQIDADGVAIMPALHLPGPMTAIRNGDGWRWQDGGRTLTASIEGEALHLTITAATGTRLDWPLPPATTGTWIIPDGAGMAFGAQDVFWRDNYAEEECLGATTLLSFPSWSYLTQTRAVTYALGDGLLSELCLRDDNGLQARLTHEFDEGSETLDLLFALRPPEPLAPALFYRQVLQSRGQLTGFADKAVPKLPRLFGAPQAYIWGDGRDLAFLDDLKALGVDRIVMSYDQDPRSHPQVVGPDWLKKADAMGYLAGPYDAFDNGQPAETSDMPAGIWPGDLYPTGCIIKADGKPMTGFANRGCYMSSEAIARYPGPFVPAQRYAGHVADGATQIFVDVDATGEFFNDFSDVHPMRMARDRDNRLVRMAMAIHDYQLVIGGEAVTAWAVGVNHYSHGTGQAHVSAVWPLNRNKERMGSWWPAGRPDRFFLPFTPTDKEARLLFGPADRVPLFEAVFHDSLVTSDRWEFGLMKAATLERQRFARAIFYGQPTMWSLDRRELARIGPWLKAAQDDFGIAHGFDTPVALTGFSWLTDDHLVQQISYADGRVLIANFSAADWQGLGPDCVRVTWSGKPASDLCPPADPPAYK